MDSQGSDEATDVISYDAEESPPLVGNVGRNFIREKLADHSKKPQQWLEEIRDRGSLKHPECAPLVDLLLHQGISASSSHKAILDQVRPVHCSVENRSPNACTLAFQGIGKMQASTMLLQMISLADSDKIRPLLDRVFPFVGIPELRPIAVAVLSHLQPIPKRNLHMLAEDNDVFWDLPLGVQQQVRFSGRL